MVRGLGSEEECMSRAQIIKAMHSGRFEPTGCIGQRIGATGGG